MANRWSETEVEAAVAAYFHMLSLELTGQKYSKADQRRALKEKLNHRSDASIEMGIPYIDGYKPRFNYQRLLLPAMITTYLKNHPQIHQLFAADCTATVPIPSVEDLLAAWEAPPKLNVRKMSRATQSRVVSPPSGLNYFEREARNQSLGAAGEQFVMHFERARLIRAGRDSLAKRIEQVSATVGSSAGFDIKSFEEDGTDRFIEVKTTKYGKSTPFFITPNEVRFSQENAKNYYLYRLFNFRESPRLFVLRGRIDEQFLFEPSEFMERLA